MPIKTEKKYIAEKRLYIDYAYGALVEEGSCECILLAVEGDVVPLELAVKLGLITAEEAA